MTEIVSCPACGRKLQIPREFFGKTVQCPQCQEQFFAETVDPAAPPPPPPLPTPKPSSLSLDDDDDYRPRPRRIDREPRQGDDYDPRSRGQSPHRGGMLLAFGIISLVFCPLLGPFTWIMAQSDLKLIRKGRIDPEGEAMTHAAYILGILGTVSMTLFGCCLCFGFLSNH